MIRRFLFWLCLLLAMLSMCAFISATVSMALGGHVVTEHYCTIILTGIVSLIATATLDPLEQ